MRNISLPFHHSLRAWSFVSICAIAMLCAMPVSAKESAVPWECTGFEGDAQYRCIKTFAQLQQEKIEKLEKELEIQQQTVQQLQQQINQQASAANEMRRQLSQSRSRWNRLPPVYAYPPLGLSLRFGRDRLFGGSLFYEAPWFYGPRWYGYGHRDWYRY